MGQGKWNRISGYLLAVVFVMMVGWLCMASLLGRDREFSENENRYLASLPELSIDKVLDGSFQKGFEEYLNDQIWQRDGWITVKTAVQKACGDSDIGGAYVGKDGYDFEKITPEQVDGELLDRNIAAVRRYFGKAGEQGIAPDRLELLVVPTSGLVMADKLPAHARMFDQAECIDRIRDGLQGYRFIDARESLMGRGSDVETAGSWSWDGEADPQLYYRTDHHWTGDGAFTAYQQWAQETGRGLPLISDYRKRTVTEEFRGSLYSKILDYDSAWDSIWVYEKDDAPDCQVSVEGEERSGFYDEGKLAEKDKYAYFFGGNYGQVQIVNPDCKEGNLLVIKDSFANAFVPLLAEHYHNIYMVDLRYHRGDMGKYLEEHAITEVLVLYNISNFLSDPNIVLLGR